MAEETAGQRWSVETRNLGELETYRFVVIFAKYQNQWLYSQHKERDTWETAGGHIEPGETCLDAARRELYEETGAVPLEIVPAFDYSVHRETGFSNGQVFFANIQRLDPLPQSEMRGVKLFRDIPDAMTYPQILPVLYHKLQMWLNIQSGKDELWDVYDEKRNLTGRLHRRGDPMQGGDFHLVVQAWIMNEKGQFLITRRTHNKGYGGMWECPGGSAVAGDSSLAAAIREVREETGLTLDPHLGECLLSLQRNDHFADIWLFRQSFELSEIVLLENETCDAKWAAREEIRQLAAAGEFVPFSYLEKLFEMIRS